MRILFLTSRLPFPPNRGDRNRSFHFLKYLSRDHDIWLASFVANESEKQHADKLSHYCREISLVTLKRWSSVLSVLTNFWRPEPLQALYYRSSAMQRLVGKLLSENDFDAVYIHLFRMAPYVSASSSYYCVLDLTDIISTEIKRSLPYRDRLWRSIYSIELPKIARYERLLAENFDETWLVSQAERLILEQYCSEANLRVVPIGVNRNRFFPTGQEPKTNSLIFLGNLGVFHNVDAAVFLVKKVLPIVRERIPAITCQIVGASPAPAVMNLDADPSVDVTGYVADLNAFLNNASIFVAPLRFAAGLQTKVIEAMATARPVVTSSIVNKGLDATPEREVMLADNEHEFADQIVRLLSDDELRQTIGNGGYEFVKRRFDWHQVVDRMREIEQQLKIV